MDDVALSKKQRDLAKAVTTSFWTGLVEREVDAWVISGLRPAVDGAGITIVSPGGQAEEPLTVRGRTFTARVGA